MNEVKTCYRTNPESEATRDLFQLIEKLKRKKTWKN